MQKEELDRKLWEPIIKIEPESPESVAADADVGPQSPTVSTTTLPFSPSHAPECTDAESPTRHAIPRGGKRGPYEQGDLFIY